MTNFDWKNDRDRIDLGQVATNLLGPAPGRRGQKDRRLWWPCPFHEDQNPSFCVTPGKPIWKCHGCGEHGDAANLVMRLRSLSFPQAVEHLLGESGGSVGGPSHPRPSKVPTAKVKNVSASPSGLPRAEALTLVAEAEARLWSSEGSEGLHYLTSERFLTEATIRVARLGWTPGVRIPKQDGGTWTARGVVMPAWDGDRLALVKVRQSGDRIPKYGEAFRDRPVPLFGSTGPPGQPLIVVEGEFDAILLGQELRELAAVVTLGSASVHPEGATLAPLLKYSPWYAATDADKAGDDAAQKWPRKPRRVRPPGSFKDWTEAAQGGVNLSRWWGERLAGVESPELFTWDELATWRWGAPAIEDTDAEDDLPEGILIPADDWRAEVAGWPMDRWTLWHQRAFELEAEEVDPTTGPAERAEGIKRAQQRAYLEIAERERTNILEEGRALA